MKKISPQRRFAYARMHRILERIQKGDFPSRPKLAQELEVAEKTVQRDINFMKDFWNFPIEYDPHKYGYHLTGPVSSFPLVNLTQKELVAVLIAEKAIAQYAGSPFEQPLRAAFKKFTAGLDGEMSFEWSELQKSISVKNIEANPASVEVFEKLSVGVRDRREVQYDYRNLDAEGFVRRQVRPLHLGCVNNQWYLFAFCLKRQAIRTFSLTRMKRLKLLDVKFPPQKFSASEHLRNSFGVFAGANCREIILQFDRFATQLVKERTWHPSQNMRMTRGGGSEVRFTLSALEEIEQWILSWGYHVQVLSPIDLVARVQAALRKASTLYDPVQKEPLPATFASPTPSSALS